MGTAAREEQKATSSKGERAGRTVVTCKGREPDPGTGVVEWCQEAGLQGASEQRTRTQACYRRCQRKGKCGRSVGKDSP